MQVPTAETLGEGKLWAVHQAQQIAGLPIEEGLAICEEHTRFGAEVYRTSVGSAKKPDLRIATRFAAVIEGTIVDWLNTDGQQLPPRHLDFALDLGSRAVQLGDSVKFVSYFNPNTPYLSTANNRLRAVRLGLPEALRVHKPAVGAVQGRLEAITYALGHLNHAPREPERPDYGRFGRGGGW